MRKENQVTHKLTWGAYRQPDGTYDAAAKMVYDPPIDGILFRSGRGLTGYKLWPVAYIVSIGEAFKLWQNFRKNHR